MNTDDLTPSQKRDVIQSHILTWKRTRYDWTISYQTGQIIGRSSEELKIIEGKIAESIKALDALESMLKELGREKSE